MEAGRRTINDIFNGSRILEIPFFQRAYVWDEPQWERLLKDVENVCKTQKPYFMGSVILKQKLTGTDMTVGDVRTVVDGQQRLTTLAILLKVLCLKNDSLNKFDKRFRLDDDRTVIQHAYLDIEAFSEVMELKKIVTLDRNSKITRAYQYFVDFLDPTVVDFNTVSSQLLFVGIDLATNEDEQQIFDTINSLGVDLTTDELLKNYFFGRNDIAQYIEYWQKVFEADEDTIEYWEKTVTTGRIKRSISDLFFYSFLQILIQDKSLNVSAEDKLAFSRVDKLFDSYKQFIEKFYSGKKLALLKEIKEYADVFRKTFDSGIIADELPVEAGVARLNAIIFYLDTTTLIPYVLFVERTVQDTSQKQSLYEYLETYIMRRLVSRFTTKNYNQLFTERLILNQVLTKEKLESYFKAQDNQINRMPTDQEVKAAFHESWLINKQATGVLYLLESKIRNRSLHSTQLLGIEKYSLEHMMPKKWRNNWNFLGNQIEADNRDKILLTLGNLTIITQNLNSSIRDSSWQKKLVGRGEKGGLKKYAEGIDTVSSFLQYQEWDEATIKERADYLAELALRTWKTDTKV